MRHAWVVGALVPLAIVLVALAWPVRSVGHSSSCALPPRDCSARCDHLVWFAPVTGVGYLNVPFPGEQGPDTSTSYVRRDLMMLMRYAAAKVACVAGGAPIVLGDISERYGLIPGTLSGAPRHPWGTHVGGRDLDLAYYQIGSVDNQLRAICKHIVRGVDQAHCVGPPDRLDARRTALLVGFLFESTQVRIVGVDGAVGPVLVDTLHTLCREGAIAPDACARVRLGFERIDLGRGWFRFHHKHMHVAMR